MLWLGAAGEGWYAAVCNRAYCRVYSRHVARLRTCSAVRVAVELQCPS
jgi:hypothetical protein